MNVLIVFGLIVYAAGQALLAVAYVGWAFLMGMLQYVADRRGY